MNTHTHTYTRKESGTKVLLLMLFMLLSSISASAQHNLDSILVNTHHIIFNVNKTIVTPEDKKWITDTLRPALEALGDKGVIYGRATASPEGPLANNIRLANGRRDAANAVLKSLGFDPSRIRYKVVAEDYDLLRSMMKKAEDPYYDMYDSLMLKYGDDPSLLKIKMQKADGGKFWKRVHKLYFPELRAVRLVAVDESCIVDGDVVSDLQPLTIAATGKEGKPEVKLEMLDIAQAKPLSTDLTKAEAAVIPAETPSTEKEEKIHRIPLLNVRTNLLYDGFYMPNYGMAPMWNVGVEFYPRRGHMTYNAWFMGPYYHKWNQHKFFQIRNYELEARYYFRRTDRAYYRGVYVGLAVDANKYGIGLNNRKGWQGEGLGGQLTLGYVLPLDKYKAWKLQFSAGVGYYYTKYDPYLYGVPDFFGHEEDGKYYYDTNLYRDEFKKRQHVYKWLGPTQLGISLSYDLLWRKGTNQKAPRGGGKSKGISLRAWEKRK